MEGRRRPPASSMLANLDTFGDEDGRAQVTLCYTPDSVIPCRSPNRNCGVIAQMFMPSHSHESRVNAFPYGIREEVQPRYTKPRAAACYKCGPSLIFLLSSLRISIRFIAIHIRASSLIIIQLKRILHWPLHTCARILSFDFLLHQTHRNICCDYCNHVV